ncbi:RHS domain-containing protein [Pseudomonas sp. GD03651]|uniref:RHS repeat-associated core domain-containing protein n=1 Tax=Pseudomonas TaxID=286 RepID=UPI002115B49B|nr:MULTISPECIES: RHS repeat-associated core domain-containing protein [Pseudomonas]MDH2184993.1 RHS domain-containing protein [Pseudomonas sp. GD03651]
MHRPAPGPFNTFAWYQCDQLGTPMKVTDERGQTSWSGTYKVWVLAQESRSEIALRVEMGNPLRFQGQYFDIETRLHYNRCRYYDLQVGRFIGTDPIGAAGGINFYSYVTSPTSWVDPDGLATKPLPFKTPVLLRSGGQQHP